MKGRIQIGKTFHRLKIVAAAGVRKGHRMVRCLCECGKRIVVRFESVRRGNTKSCGCWDREQRRSHGKQARHFVHGACLNHQNSPEMKVYRSMLDRCLNPRNDKFKFYGGANPPVRISQRWLGKRGFQNFLADMGPRPSQQHSIGRILDVPLYSAETCEWETIGEQGANRRGKTAMQRFEAVYGKRAIHLSVRKAA